MKGLHLLLLMVAHGAVFGADFTPLKKDERIVFHPSVAQRVPGSDQWRIQVRGCVFEPEKRTALLAVFQESLELKDVEMNPAEQAVFRERARYFLVDHERGKEIHLRFGDNVFRIGKSGADGRFAGEFVHSTNVPGRIHFQAALSPDDHRVFEGECLPLEATGLSVISDIDDTIKITEVLNREATLRNTFLREFRAVPGMAQFYRSLARTQHVAFHYISASPWQLYEPLSAFVRSNGFPAGSFELKPFRWKDRRFFNLFADPVKYKRSVIEPYFKQFPQRQFVLIGDSGERDPEIYGGLARQYPGRILAIFIREVTGEPATAARYEKAFHEVPRTKWQVFREAGEIRLDTN